ncbi:uncharacterized protein LOC103185162 [Callorhinchus milii]|uniref:uncharacterized protein LOC103185162 n=1 Tax=Callorhinchus milii TaxID=7868 RepID=UPI001C3F7BD0|nr:uncharacterized protein LOC103185162 [Callorhinchus milii]
MKNKTIAGFSVTKCSAFQFFKKRVRRWMRSPKVSVDKYQPAHMRNSDTFVSTPTQKDAEPQLWCQSHCQECHLCQVIANTPDVEECAHTKARSCKVNNSTKGRRWKKTERFNTDSVVGRKWNDPDLLTPRVDKVTKESQCYHGNITHKSDGSREIRKGSKGKKQCQDEHVKRRSEKHFMDNFDSEFSLSTCVKVHFFNISPLIYHSAQWQLLSCLSKYLLGVFDISVFEASLSNCANEQLSLFSFVLKLWIDASKLISLM